MPLKIRELHIKVTVNKGEGQPSPAEAPPGTNNVAMQNKNQSAIVAECVDQVLEILKEKMEA